MSTVDTQPYFLNETVEADVHRLIEEVDATGDKKTAHKCREAWHKLQNRIVHIGFCGLFSAGKSSMINALLEEDLLPSGPIPTTANVVTISSGSPGASIVMANGHKLELGIQQLDDWQAYCKDGEQVQKVDIYHRHELLEGVQILDTPGIDSNDLSHQKATEEALYLADVVVFVADYHHVQSELNYHFLKTLQEQGKTLFFVINQIDKHQDHELPVHSFVQRLQEGLQDWGIDVEGIIPTSIKNPGHSLNFLPALKKILLNVGQHRSSFARKHFAHALKQLLGEYRHFLRETQADQRDALQNKLEQLKQESDYDDHPHLLEEYEQDKYLPQQWVDEVMEETRKITKDAIITPYTTTRLAEELIQSYQKDFRPGWFFTNKKKRKQQQVRAQKLYADISARIQSQVEWHLKDLLRKKAEQYQVHDTQLQQAVVDWELTLPRDWLTSSIKTNVDIRQFVYTYTQELTQKVARMYEEQVEKLALRVKTWLDERHEDTYAPLQGKIEQFRCIAEEKERMEMLEKEIEQRIAPYQQWVEQMLVHDSQGFAVHKIKWDLPDVDILSSLSASSSVQSIAPLPQTTVSKSDTDSHVPQYSGDLHQTHIEQESAHQQRFSYLANKLEQAADLLTPYPPLHHIVQDYQRRAERLKNKRFQICLFGAFSAGKSSFANALLGEAVLPVSAHPTTASINYIKAPTEEHAHNTALVRMKSKEQVEEEINFCLKRLSLSSKGGLPEKLDQIDHIKPQHIRSSLKPYESFLRACAKGYDAVSEYLGTSIPLNRGEYQTYVSVEHQACFVADIQLFYDSPLSRAGIELIDTPGADSIYARHTRVTFDFIKHADVILYVTYYNHAFSRADREFLDQLGRVKDQFALDKMFFLINAADLAESKQELDHVTQYVENELLASGLRFPRLFPISSLKAMQGDPESRMEPFKQALQRFMEDELFGLLTTSAEQDLQRGYHVITDLYNDLQESAADRQKKSAQLKRNETEWIRTIGDQDRKADLQEMNKEIQELFYYVQQRLSYTWKEYFNEAFSPSVLTAGKANRRQLHDCLEEFTDLLLSRLNAETNATGLRMENVLLRLRDRFVQEWQEVTEPAGISLNQDSLPKKSYPIPPISEEWPTDYNPGLSGALRHFKQPKHFFEQGGKNTMFQAMEPILKDMVEEYVLQAIKVFEDHYRSLWYSTEEETKNWLKKAIHSAVEAKQSVLRGEIADEQLQRLQQTYKQNIL